MNKFKEYVLSVWNKLSDNAKTKIISAVNTFGSVLVITIAGTLVTTGNIEWSLAFWGGLFSAGIREGVKAMIAPFLPVRLGGKKKV